MLQLLDGVRVGLALGISLGLVDLALYPLRLAVLPHLPLHFRLEALGVLGCILLRTQHIAVDPAADLIGLGGHVQGQGIVSHVSGRERQKLRAVQGENVLLPIFVLVLGIDPLPQAV